jgi:hypothetical protein
MKNLNPIVKTLICYGAAFLVGGGLFYLYIALREFPTDVPAENYRMLSDAATIPGLLFVMLGGLLWAASKGAVDGLTYALHHVFRALIPGARLKGEETYADYIEKQKEKRMSPRGYSFLFIVGVVFLLATGVFIFLYYRAL